MNEILNHSKSDIILFIDNDYVPLTSKALEDSISRIKSGMGAYGIAQVANHLNNGMHIYIGAPFITVSRKAIIQIEECTSQKVGLLETFRSVVAEKLTCSLEQSGIPIHLYYPSSWKRSPRGRSRPWAMRDHHTFGIGTIYDKKIFHLFEGCYSENVDLFVEGHLEKRAIS